MVSTTIVDQEQTKAAFITIKTTIIVDSTTTTKTTTATTAIDSIDRQIKEQVLRLPWEEVQQTFRESTEQEVIPESNYIDP